MTSSVLSCNLICNWACVFICFVLLTPYSIDAKRNGKLLFNIVSFANAPCTGTSGDLGTCLTHGECIAKEGLSSGNCASGFGTCCVFIVNTCGATVTQNCTYVQNPNFPTEFNTDGDCNFAILQVDSNICSVRLDMDTFDIAGPDLSTDQALCSSDSFQAVASIGATVPEICGANTGQHMYLNAGFTDNSNLALNFNLNGGTGRRWRIKVSQIPCGTLYTPEPNCLMYLTGVSGQVRSYNFVATSQQYRLRFQNYEICVRQEQGYCQIAWTPSTDEDSFRLSADGAFAKSRAGIGVCGVDFVIIPNGHNGDNICMARDEDRNLVSTQFVDRYCGARLNCIDQSEVNSDIFSDRFTISYHTNGEDPDPDTNRYRGFCLNWRQIPC